MIHNPMTVAMGNAADMEKAIDMLSSVKDSIINAYELKTGLSRAKISHLMDDETWMDANKAVELGFADEILSRPKLTAPKKEEEPAEPEKTEGTGEEEEDQEEPKKASMLFSRKVLEAEFMSKLRSYTAQKPSVPDSTERPVKDIMARLDTIKKFM